MTASTDVERSKDPSPEERRKLTALREGLVRERQALTARLAEIAAALGEAAPGSSPPFRSVESKVFEKAAQSVFDRHADLMHKLRQ